jgi:hypothetical protein
VFCDVCAYALQTSSASVDFTYDNWSTIIRTLERMDARGTIIERGAATTGGMGADGVSKNVGSVLTVHGADAESAAGSILTHHQAQRQRGGPGHARGSPQQAAVAAVGEGNHQIQFSSSYASWAPSPPCRVHASPFAVNGYLRSASLLSNGQTVLPSLQRPLLSGSNMFRSGAYVHQYQACGLEVEDFITAFRSLGQIVNNYQSLK